MKENDMLTAAQRLRNMARGLRKNGKSKQASNLEERARELEGHRKNPEADSRGVFIHPQKGPNNPSEAKRAKMSAGSKAKAVKVATGKADQARYEATKARAMSARASIDALRARKAAAAAKATETKAEVKEEKVEKKVATAKKAVTKAKKAVVKAKTPKAKSKAKSKVKAAKKKVATVKKAVTKAKATVKKDKKKVATKKKAVVKAKAKAKTAKKKVTKAKAKVTKAKSKVKKTKAKKSTAKKSTAKKTKKSKSASHAKVTKIGTMSLESPPKAKKPKAAKAKKATSKASKKTKKSGSKPKTKRTAKQRANDKRLGAASKARAAGKPAKKSKAKKSTKSKKTKAKTKKPTKAQKKKAAAAKKKAGLKPKNLPGFAYGAKPKKAGKLKSVSTTTGYIDDKGKAVAGKHLTKKNSAEARKAIGQRKISKAGRKSLTTRTIYGDKDAKKTRIYVDRHYNYRVNATPDGIKAFVVFGTTVAVAVVAADIVDRIVATRGAAGSTHGYIGHDATERIMERPNGVRIATALGLTTVSFAAAYFARKSMTLSAMFAGVALGSIVSLGIKVINGWAMPMVLPVATGAETEGRAGWGNRLFGFQQKIPQEALRLQREKVDALGLSYPGMAADIGALTSSDGSGSPYLYTSGGFPFSQPVDGVVMQGLVETGLDETTTPPTVTLAGSPSTVDEVYGGCSECGGIGLACGCMSRGAEIAKKMAQERALAEQQVQADLLANLAPVNGLETIQVPPVSGLRLLPSPMVSAFLNPIRSTPTREAVGIRRRR